MPIANCIVAPMRKRGSGNLVKLWSDESGKSSDHMTINIVYSDEQFGNQYAVMANLLLPSIWSSADVSSLQVGLANALAAYFSISLSEIHIATTIVGAGMVVENGKEIQW